MTYELLNAFLDIVAQVISLGASFAIMFRYLRRPSDGLTRLDAFLLVLAMPSVMP